MSRNLLNNSEKLIDVENLAVHFHVPQGTVKAVDGISFDIGKGKSLGIVGESGCGKTITALTMMLLHPHPEAKIEKGSIHFYRHKNEMINLVDLDVHSKIIRRIRGNEIAMIFQEPMMSLNPVHKIGDQLMEIIRLHQQISKSNAKQVALDALDMVKISAPVQRMNEYPFQISGGMRQRVMIAMALCCKPKLLIADEPTTALDVTIEAEILKLIKDLQNDLNMSLMMITHDLGVIGEVTDQVAVMYVGKIVEKASTKDLFKEPLHPYTQGLFKSRPEIKISGRLDSIKGSVPSPYEVTHGCSFAPRCDFATSLCRSRSPELISLDGREVSCWKYADQGGI